MAIYYRIRWGQLYYFAFYIFNHLIILYLLYKRSLRCFIAQLIQDSPLILLYAPKLRGIRTKQKLHLRKTDAALLYIFEVLYSFNYYSARKVKRLNARTVQSASA